MLSIRQRQLNLRTYMYYYKGNIDGIEGNLTKDAYKNFQANNCLIVDGIYGVNTENKLILCIKDLQNLLNKHESNLVVDGIVGDNTVNAIKCFQRKNNIEEDGIVGNITFGKLGIYNQKITWEDIKHFKKEEFNCPCCGFNNIDVELVKILDEIRDYFNLPIIITSGTRCNSYNSKVGGVQGSRHLCGKAADFYVKGIDINIVLNYCKKLVKNGVLRYTYTNNQNMSGAVHIDIN